MAPSLARYVYLCSHHHGWYYLHHLVIIEAIARRLPLGQRLPCRWRRHEHEDQVRRWRPSIPHVQAFNTYFVERQVRYEADSCGVKRRDWLCQHMVDDVSLVVHEKLYDEEGTTITWDMMAARWREVAAQIDGFSINLTHLYRIKEKYII
jgi:hypothetical protein